ncbi:MAG TPA: HYR domain-containing protein, partial [Acidimicrobiales bacterium]|nr:HYR domain-containing protein [Acidimicrobiales bacterium]
VPSDGSPINLPCATVVNSATSSVADGTVTAVAGILTARAEHGAGTVGVARYNSNVTGVVGHGLPSGATGFFDVALSAGNTFRSVEVSDCYAPAGSGLWWWDPAANGGSGGWRPASDVTTDAQGCLELLVTPTTSPSLQQLTGTVFAVSRQPSGPPTLTPHPAVVAEATSGAGAMVSYTPPSATSSTGSAVPVSCSPPPGSLFALGVTTVNCSASDPSGGGTSHESFTVTVRDTTPPVLSLPGNQAVDALSPAGARLSLSVSARDAVDGSVTPVCHPALGSTFPVNAAGQVTTVSCSAIDAHGNSTTGTFTVHVRGAAEQLSDLQAALATGGLPAKDARDLAHQLSEVGRQLGSSKPDATRHVGDALGEFIHHVWDGASAKHAAFGWPVAGGLIQAAQHIQDAIGYGDARLVPIVDLVDAWHAPWAQTHPLMDQLRSADDALARHDSLGACRALDRLATQVTKDSGRKGPLTASQAAQYARTSTAVRAAVGC